MNEVPKRTCQSTGVPRAPRRLARHKAQRLEGDFSSCLARRARPDESDGRMYQRD